MVIWLAVLAALIALQRLMELILAGHNRLWMLAQGAQEFGAGHYPLFFILQIGWLVGWVAIGVS
jgi:methyltransferase